MIEKVKRSNAQETAVLVGIITQEQTEDQVQEYLNELEFLAHTAGAVVKKQFTQKRNTPDNKTFVGSGKFNEIHAFIKAEKEKESPTEETCCWKQPNDVGDLPGFWYPPG